MLFQRELLAGLTDGTITLTFRRWRRPNARPGSRHRSPIGLIAIDTVEPVADVTDDDARRAGYPSRADLLADLDKYGDGPIYRIALRLDGPDPRIALRERAEVTADERTELVRRLARYDAASRSGPWTGTTLQLIADHPGERAEDLAKRVDREKLPFKVDVRKLKELGLTESLEIGYRLSPRGESFLRGVWRPRAAAVHGVPLTQSTNEVAMSSAVDTVRGFNRFYTRVIGVLGEGLLRTPFSLTEVRVLFELAQRDATEVTALRQDLDLDAGYLSRMLTRFEADGLVNRHRSDSDARRQTVRLTESGRATFDELDTLAAGEIRQMLAPLAGTDQRRLLSAMGTIRQLLEPAPATFTLRDLRPGDLGWVVQRHGALYAEEYGWDGGFEALVARIVADFAADHDPEREWGWIAEVAGEPVGCIFCMAKADRTAQLRLLVVEPSARGLGIGARLVDECLTFAANAGYERITLWTTSNLAPARHLYERAGFALDEEETRRRFGHDLTGQTWSRPL